MKQDGVKEPHIQEGQASFMEAKGRMDTVIRNGTAVLKDEVRSVDIGIKDGRIAQLGTTGLPQGAREIDATGLIVMPGMIDAHVHLNEPGLGDWEGFETGSAALAAGGCTTYLDMPLNGVPPTVTVAAFEQKLAAARGRSHVDYALWGGLVPGKLDHLIPLHEAGVIGYKAFMSEPGGPGEDAFARVDDYTLLEGMKIIASVGKVLALHAESEPIVSKLGESAKREGRTSAADFVASRPIIAELEAIHRALFYAERTGCALHFVHISSEEGVRMISEAKRRGVDVTVETCPHYLTLTDGMLARKGAAAKCAPPLRNAEEQQKLWGAVASGQVDMISSDHSPCPEEMKDKEHFADAWGGIAGAQSSLELIVGEGHVKRGLPLTAISRMLSYEPAKRFGLLDRKGEIRIGADADLALVDLNAAYELKKEQLYHRHKHSPYIGETMWCAVRSTLSRGRVVYDGKAGLTGGMTGEWQRYRRV
ncbi:allantoinase [Paenibacillus sp. LHD-117]|uniref:allantoinase n=1 Tax=Paenibacillus sp. LHD-117 TaxID=3071412 RepID=UPI0027E1C2D2|nr:allantoinase [Paenibacillus sp. LHD-117]MDQ6418812.1 allantoinase [Paenibacillus sp. LHD-117]